MKKCKRRDECEIYYLSKYDAFICLYCDDWLDKVCQKSCDFCDIRPDKPSQALGGEPNEEES
jgi:hypothetical protein